MLKGVTVAYWGISIPNFPRIPHTDSNSDCTSLHVYQQWIRVLLSPHPDQHVLSFIFLTLDILIRGRWNLKVILKCIYLKTKDMIFSLNKTKICMIANESLQEALYNWIHKDKQVKDKEIRSREDNGRISIQRQTTASIATKIFQTYITIRCKQFYFLSVYKCNTILWFHYKKWSKLTYLKYSFINEFKEPFYLIGGGWENRV